jgi:starvation-inducible DNA-binding protein
VARLDSRRAVIHTRPEAEVAPELPGHSLSTSSALHFRGTPMTNAIHDGLTALQADYQVLYQKIRHYHWNVRGPQFFQLHPHFEQMYLATALKIDEIAERLLALGAPPLRTYGAVLKIARIKEDASLPNAQEMVRALHTDLQALNVHLRALAEAARKADDPATENLADGYADAQEKEAWMLRAFLEA